MSIHEQHINRRQFLKSTGKVIGGSMLLGGEFTDTLILLSKQERIRNESLKELQEKGFKPAADKEGLGFAKQIEINSSPVVGENLKRVLNEEQERRGHEAAKQQTIFDMALFETEKKKMAEDWYMWGIRPQRKVSISQYEEGIPGYRWTLSLPAVIGGGYLFLKGQWELMIGKHRVKSHNQTKPPDTTDQKPAK